MNKAVFLDRDGVINKLIYNPQTQEYESPHEVEYLKFYPGVLPALKRLKEMGYLLFIVSNQPSYAKGKISLKNIKVIHRRFHKYLCDHGIKFTEYYYCYHHSNGNIPKYSYDCECRKPKPFFLLKAKKKYKLDMMNSWFVGDSDSDIFCGQSCGVKTILIKEEHSREKRGKSHPDFFANDFKEAVKIISYSKR